MRVPLLAALFTLTACDQLYVEAVVPELCQHLDRQSFVVPPEVRARYAQLPAELTQDYSLEKTFAFDVTVELPSELKKIDTRFSLTYVRLTAIAPANFGFLTSATITVEPPKSSSLEPYTINYARQTPNPTEILWQGDHLDLSPYLRVGDLQYAVSMVGSLPDEDVVADVDACLAAAAKLNYLAQ